MKDGALLREISREASLAWKAPALKTVQLGMNTSEVKFSKSDGSDICTRSDAKIKNIDKVGLLACLLSEECKKDSKDGAFVLTLGGDHSISIGSISGMHDTYPDICVIWIDAHAVISNNEDAKHLWQFICLQIIAHIMFLSLGH